MKDVSAALAPTGNTTPASIAASPFHEGERAAQERAGVAMEADQSGRRAIRAYMPEQHREFFSSLPFMVLGGVDASGQPWATIRAGRPGFVSSPDNRALCIHGGTLPGDPLAGHWTVGGPIGGLGIQPHTRRRNRVNGVVTQADEDEMTIGVQQSFGNCPKYITTREAVFAETGQVRAEVTDANEITEDDRRLISAADTFFIASANLDNPERTSRGVDVSHRGGEPGFVRIEGDGSLTIPDYVGNNFFNSIGNLLRDPRAGLLFIDFVTGDLLYLATRAHIEWDAAMPAKDRASDVATAALTRRVIQFHVEQVRRVRGALPLHWKPVTAASTSSTAIVGVLPSSDVARRWRTLQIIQVVDESPSVRSFLLQPCDGQALEPFAAGQFLPVRAVLTDSGAAVVRNYTLSSAKDAASPQAYRISVKRSGAFSHWLHDVAGVGSHIEALPPRGEFTLDADSKRPVVLAAAGIGITPMVALLDGVRRIDADRKVHLFYGTRRLEESAFSKALVEIAATDPNLSLYIFESASKHDMRTARRFAGRVDSDALRRLLPFDGYDFYLCGPQAFMHDLHTGLRALDVAEERIFSEAFGPSRLTRSVATALPQAATANGGAQDGAIPIAVTFSRTGRSVSWSAQDRNLLGTVERCGLDVPSSCQAGVCGTCATRVLDGAVEYDTPPDAVVDAGHALICVARPSSQGVTLDL